MRRKDREISLQDAINILNKGEYGVLATCGSDDHPYAVPLNYVYFDNSIYFHCANEGHKLDNIVFNEKVSFCVVGAAKVLPEQFSTLYESTIVFGRAKKVFGEEKRNALVKLIEKYSKDYLEEGLKYIDNEWDKVCVIKIEIEKITGKAKRL